MNTLDSVSSSLVTLTRAENSLMLVVAPHAGMPLMVELAARLALNGTVRVLDGGNRFNIYPVAQAVRRLTPKLEGTLANISLSRAFTCYQVLTLLEETPAAAAPTLVLDLLSTFLDENVRLPESRRLLQLSIVQLKRLSQSAPVIMSAKPLLRLSADRLPLLELLEQSSTRAVHLESQHEAPAANLPLFG
jgi:hypothetical protein